MESRRDRTGQNNILLSCPISPQLHARSRLYEFGVYPKHLIQRETDGNITYRVALSVDHKTHLFHLMNSELSTYAFHLMKIFLFPENVSEKQLSNSHKQAECEINCKPFSIYNVCDLPYILLRETLSTHIFHIQHGI